MVVCHKFFPFHHIQEKSIIMLANLVKLKVLLTIKTITMKRILSFITLALLTLFVYIESYKGEKVSNKACISSKNVVTNQENVRTKAYHPIIFGSIFIVIDEGMVYFE